MKLDLFPSFYKGLINFAQWYWGDVKIHQPRPSNTAAIQGQPMVRCPDPLRLSGPFRASYVLGCGGHKLDI